MTGHVIVIGATGGIGSRVVDALLGAGHRVIAIARDEDALRALVRGHDAGAGLIAVHGTFEGEEQAAALVRDIRALRVRIDAVIASIAAPLKSGRVLEGTAQSLTDSFARNVVPHFLAAKHLLPLLAERKRATSYLIVGCATADFAWAGYGEVSISAAARKMLVHVLREESKELPVRIQLLQIEGRVCTHKNARTACPAWVSADTVGQQIVELLEHSNDPAMVVHVRAPAAGQSNVGERS